MALLLNRLPSAAVTGSAAASALDAYATTLGQLGMRGAQPTYAVAASYLWRRDWFDSELGDVFRSSTSGGLIIGHARIPTSADTRDDRVRELAMVDDDIKARFGSGFAYAAPSNLPVMGSQHAKFIIIVYPRCVRIAIVSNNLIPLDWLRKTGSLFVQTFPLLPGASDADIDAGTVTELGSRQLPPNDFGQSLVAMLRTMQAGAGAAKPAFETLIWQLRQFDFRGARADLVASVPGTMVGADMARWGHTRIAALLRATGPEDTAERRGDVLLGQYSSSGSPYVPTDPPGRAQPTPPLLEQLAGALGTLALRAPPAAAAAAAPPTDGGGGGGGLNSAAPHAIAGIKRPRGSGSDSVAFPPRAAPAALPWQLVWPTEGFIRRSTEGWSGGASVPGSYKTQPTAVRRHWHAYEGAPGAGRDRSTPHCKFFLRYVPPRAGVRPATAAAAAATAVASASASPPRDSEGGSVIVLDDSSDDGEGAAVGAPPPSSALLVGQRGWGTGQRGDAALELLVGPNPPPIPPPGVELLVVVTGSHNLSGAAWGITAQPSKPPALTMRSYELGVLLTPRRWAVSLVVEAAQVAAGRFPPEAWSGTSGMAVPRPSGAGVAYAAAAASTAWAAPREVVLRALPWAGGRVEGGGAAGAPAVVWLPLPFRVPPRPYRAREQGWTMEGCAAVGTADGSVTGGAQFQGLDGFGHRVFEATLSATGDPRPVAPDPGE